MLRNIDWPKNLTYKARTEYVPEEFYLSILENSKEFDLLLGYFSTTAIRRLSLGFATFINNGGNLRLVINHILSEKDRDAIKAGIEGNFESNLINITDPIWLKNTLGEYGRHFFECISWLIQNDRIRIKIIRPKHGDGIAHYKQGVISDGNDRVSFYGSCNFTEYGLVENLESLRVTLEWSNELSKEQVHSDAQYFNDIFEELDDEIEYLMIDEVVTNIRDVFKGKTIEDLLIKEEELTLNTMRHEKSKRLERIALRLSDKIESYSSKPRFPFPEGPRQYQKEAYQKWIENNRSGIFAMATGTGKTITALNCILEEYKINANYAAIVLVPTKVLVSQWEKEVSSFNFQNKVEISSDYSQWTTKLKNLDHRLTVDKDMSFILVSTYASLKSKSLRSFLKQHSNKMIIIADESHNIGAAETRRILAEMNFKSKLALSATPSRKYDEEGTDFVDKYFEDSYPYVYSYSMDEAIQNGILVQYYYNPVVVEMTHEEKLEYDELSERIRRLSFDSDNTIKKASKEALEILLIQRKRIIDKASNKFVAFREIIKKLASEKNLTYTLIYSSDGFVSDHFDTDEYFETDEDLRNIDVYSSIVRSETGDSVRIGKYTSSTEDRSHLLKSFEDGSLNVLISMKCLDEGVDVPRTRAAIFCSSSGNSRQFIQRRGRILRRAKGKDFAYIYDLVVVPPLNSISSNSKNETSILKTEFQRVLEFANMASNKYEALGKLEDYGMKYGIDIYGV